MSQFYDPCCEFMTARLTFDKSLLKMNYAKCSQSFNMFNAMQHAAQVIA